MRTLAFRREPLCKEVKLFPLLKRLLSIWNEAALPAQALDAPKSVSVTSNATHAYLVATVHYALAYRFHCFCFATFIQQK